jgi:hypothetical protein
LVIRKREMKLIILDDHFIDNRLNNISHIIYNIFVV